MCVRDIYRPTVSPFCSANTILFAFCRQKISLLTFLAKISAERKRVPLLCEADFYLHVCSWICAAFQINCVTRQWNRNHLCVPVNTAEHACVASPEKYPASTDLFEANTQKSNFKGLEQDLLPFGFALHCDAGGAFCFRSFKRTCMHTHVQKTVLKNLMVIRTGKIQIACYCCLFCLRFGPKSKYTTTNKWHPKTSKTFFLQTTLSHQQYETDVELENMRMFHSIVSRLHSCQTCNRNRSVTLYFSNFTLFTIWKAPQKYLSWSSSFQLCNQNYCATLELSLRYCRLVKILSKKLVMTMLDLWMK